MSLTQCEKWSIAWNFHCKAMLMKVTISVVTSCTTAFAQMAALSGGLPSPAAPAEHNQLMSLLAQHVLVSLQINNWGSLMVRQPA